MPNLTDSVSKRLAPTRSEPFIHTSAIPKACSLILTSNGFLTPEPERDIAPRDNLMQSVGYPRPGDVPVLNRKVTIKLLLQSCRIFKGQRVPIREHPYVASIRRHCSHYLTGALITKTVVVTVAHPLVDVPVQELNIVLGENYCDRGAALLTVVLMIIHQDFDPYTLRNDVAMLRTYETVTYKSNIKGIVLMAPVPKIPLTGKKAFVTGWGRCDNMVVKSFSGTELCLDRTSKYYPDEKIDPMLRTVTFTFKLNNYYCDGYKRHDVTLHPGMLCAGVAREEDQVTPCLGVPGALLVVEARLAGILSWGFGCGYSYDLPLVYTDIRHFGAWVLHNNRVMHQIMQKNLTVLFEATKAVVLAQWLLETRNVTPKLTIRTDKNIKVMLLDAVLIQLKGTIYDIRDFINDGAYKEDKAHMYTTLKSEYVKSQTPAKLKLRPLKLKPFLANETRMETDFN